MLYELTLRRRILILCHSSLHSRDQGGSGAYYEPYQLELINHTHPELMAHGHHRVFVERGARVAIRRRPTRVIVGVNSLDQH